MAKQHAMFLLTLAMAIFMWFLDAVFDFYCIRAVHNQTFWDYAVFNVPMFEIKQRVGSCLCVMAWGYFMHRLSDRKFPR